MIAPHVVQLQRVYSVPLAVIRRHVRPAVLSRVGPDCCGIVWSAVRAQSARGGRHVALYWDDAIGLEAGVELEGSFKPVQERSVCDSDRRALSPRARVVCLPEGGTDGAGSPTPAPPGCSPSCETRRIPGDPLAMGSGVG